MWGQVYGDRETEEVNHIDVIIVGETGRIQSTEISQMITKDEIQELLRMFSSEDDVTSLSQALSQVLSPVLSPVCPQLINRL